MDLYDKESNINKNKADNAYFHFLKQIKLVDPSNVIYKPKEEKKIIDGMEKIKLVSYIWYLFKFHFKNK